MPTVFITTPTEEANDLARELLERKLAACVNQVDCQSTYRWEGEVITEPETILFVKTTAEKYPQLVEAVETIHPYDVPCIERFDESDVYPAYAEWIASVTTTHSS